MRLTFASSDLSFIMSAGGVAGFARRVLQASDPSEKVRLTTEAVKHWETCRHTGSVVMPPDMPARPNVPKIVSPGNMPNVRQVDVPANVYHVHGLAHVELNAIDLCFDTMLRFGEGVWGEDWVGDWIKIASDEARHFSWLDRRLRQLGSFYGALPAHGIIWKGAEISKIGRKERLVLGQLVAEARGLDAGPRLVKRLVGTGDNESAKVVQVIADEEMEHVRLGVKWFLIECETEGLDAAEEFKRIALEMSNPGAFAPPFEVERRRKAGLLPEWYMPVAEEMQRVIDEQRKRKKHATKMKP